MTDEAYQPTDRRPIASRRWGVFRRLATRLARRGVGANAISLAGMGAALAAGALLWLTAALESVALARLSFVAAALLIQLRLLANMLDGMVAIESGQASRVGELYNEAPDRIADAAVLIGAGYALGGDATLGYLAACIALFVAYVRTLGKASGAANEFCGPMAKQQRMFIVTVAALYIALTPAPWQPVWTVGGRIWGAMAIALIIIIAGGMLTAARRLARIARQLRKGRA